MEKSQNLSGAKIEGSLPIWHCLPEKSPGGQKSGGMYCSLHNEKYGQKGISLSPKRGRGGAAPEGSRA